MKKVLLSLGFAMFSQFSFGQGATCSSSTVISTNGTYTAASITGTYFAGCPTGSPSPAPTNGAWYSFTPTSSGSVTISSDLTQNNGTAKRNETRLSVYTGTCGTLTCVAGSDDVSGTNYLSEATFNVTAGTTYYVQWDNSWVGSADPQASLGFDFTYSFTSCSPITALNVSSMTTTSATITWTAPTPTPASYDIEYGALGFTQGMGTMANVTTPTYTFPAQAAGSNIGFYIRTNCGTSQGTWMGPYVVYLPKSAPYSNNFDNASNRSDGFISPAGWGINLDDPTATPPLVVSHTASAIYFCSTDTTQASNEQLYSAPFNLMVGTTNNIAFWTRLFPLGSGGLTTPMTLKLYYNTTRSLTGATQIGSAITVNGTTYTQQTASFTVPTSGTYYLIFSNETASATNATALLFDTFSITGTLGTSDLVLTKNASLSPNPTSDILNIKTDSKINAVSVVDMTGRKVNVKLQGNQVDVKELPVGNYLINIETKDGVSTQKFIKK